jgi:hypothetical protein
MQMDSLSVLLGVVLWLLLLAVALQQGRPASTSGQLATWLVLTGVTLACGFLVAFFAVHALLFLLGREAALVGLIVSAVSLAGIPVACGRLIRHRTRHSPSPR